MISSLHLKNFKMHAETTVELVPITIFIGPNNSGKSSLFQALLNLRQAARKNHDRFCEPAQRQDVSAEQPYLFPTERIIDLGDFKDVLRRGEKEIQIGVSGYTPLSERLAHDEHLVKVEFKVHMRENKLVYHKGHVSFREGIRWEWPGQEVPLRLDGAAFGFTGSSSFQLLSLRSMNLPTEYSPERQTDLRELAESLEKTPLRVLESIHPIFPLRGFEEFGYPLPEQPAQNLERLAHADRSVAIASILAYNRELEEQLSSWLEDLLEMRIKVKLLPGKKVTIWSERTGRDSSVLFTNEGTGAHQLPFILVPIGLTPPGQTILLSEPEAHLHPKAQTDLVSLLLTIAKKENHQFLIETHSEHVLHSFLHAVSTGKLEPEQLAVYYFEAKRGVTVTKRLEIDEKGRVQGGLPGFFEHSLSELAEYLDALRKS